MIYSFVALSTLSSKLLDIRPWILPCTIKVHKLSINNFTLWTIREGADFKTATERAALHRTRGVTFRIPRVSPTPRIITII